MRKLGLTFLMMCLSLTAVLAQDYKNRINENESKVPQFTLPDVLTCNNGKKVKTIKDWETIRRLELLEIFSSLEYGRTPTEKIKVSYDLLSEDPNALNGKATRKQVLFTFTNGRKKIEAILLLYLPNKVNGKAPVFIGYNFLGNQSTTTEKPIFASPSMHLSEDPSSEVWIRASQKRRWPFEMIIDRGYAVATMFYGDIYPDLYGLRDYSIISLFSDYDKRSKNHDEWNAIGAWAWGSSRIADYIIDNESRIDGNRIALLGHSRQGKAALWAGAQDTRFKVVISNCSGCGGAALSKRVFGENVARITTTFPHWFCPAFNQYAGNEASMPFDQHELLALIAPRHLYVASAEEDMWADQKGEYLGAYYTKDVYKLYGMHGLDSPIPPAIEQPIHNDVGYHIRRGIHDVTNFDWTQYLNYCDKYMK